MRTYATIRFKNVIKRMKENNDLKQIKIDDELVWNVDEYLNDFRENKQEPNYMYAEFDEEKEPDKLVVSSRFGIGHDFMHSLIDKYDPKTMEIVYDYSDLVSASILSKEELKQDAKITGIAHDRGKGLIIAVNKWDAIEKDDRTIYEFQRKVEQILTFASYAQTVFISAKTGQRVNRLFENIDLVIQNQNLRVGTGVLNEIMSEAVAMQQPPTDKGKRLKLFYITQVAVKPPTFVVFVNDRQLMHFSYTRYLENRIRDTFGFKGTALKFIIRERKENE